MVVINNLTPAVRNHYRVGVPFKGKYSVLLNSDDAQYGGTGNYKIEPLKAIAAEWNGRAYHVELTVPPLCTVILKVD